MSATAPAPSPASAPATSTAPGYHPRRTLPLRVEAMRQLRRRRTLVVGAVLAALPFILIAAFAIGGQPDGSDSRNGPSLIDTATASGANFAATCLFVSAGFLLVVPVALFCGDTIASEASWSSLRYLLAAPVPRMRLLTSKFLVALGFSAAAMLLLPVVALAAGTVAYGWGDLQIPTGGSLPPARRCRGWASSSRSSSSASWSPRRSPSGSRRSPTPRSAPSAEPSGSPSSATSWTPSPRSAPGAICSPPTGSTPGPTPSSRTSNGPA